MRSIQRVVPIRRLCRQRCWGCQRSSQPAKRVSTSTQLDTTSWKQLKIFSPFSSKLQGGTETASVSLLKPTYHCGRGHWRCYFNWTVRHHPSFTDCMRPAKAKEGRSPQHDGTRLIARSEHQERRKQRLRRERKWREESRRHSRIDGFRWSSMTLFSSFPPNRCLFASCSIEAY